MRTQFASGPGRDLVYSGVQQLYAADPSAHCVRLDRLQTRCTMTYGTYVVCASRGGEGDAPHVVPAVSDTARGAQLSVCVRFELLRLRG